MRGGDGELEGNSRNSGMMTTQMGMDWEEAAYAI
jgi:hypothetical protein